MKLSTLLFIFTSTIILTNCGGGGSDDSDGPGDPGNPGNSSGQVIFNKRVSNQEVFMASNGNGVAIWTSENNDGNESLWSSSYDAATNSWSNAVEIASYNRDIFFFDAASNDNGELHVVWSQFDTNLTFGVFADGIYDDQIWGNHYQPASGWAGPALIQDPAPADARTYIMNTPKVAINNNNVAMLIWKQEDFDAAVGDEYEIHSMRFDTATDWTGPFLVDDVITESSFNTVDIDINDNGDAIALFIDSIPSRKYLLANHYSTASGWNSPASADFIESDPLSDINNFGKTKLRILNNGDAIVQWSQLATSTATTSSHGRHYTASSTSWGTTYNIEPNIDTSNRAFDIVFNQQGNGFFLFTEFFSGGVFPLRARSFSFASVFSPAQSVTIPDESLPLLTAEAAIDNDGNAIALWTYDRPDGNGNGFRTRPYDPVTGWGETREMGDYVVGGLAVDIIPDGNGNAMTLHLRQETIDDYELVAEAVTY